MTSHRKIPGRNEWQMNPILGPVGPEQAFWVTPADLEQAAHRTNQGAAEVEGHQHQLKHYVMGLQSFWTGSAHAQFLELMGNWDIYAVMLNNALIDIARGMEGNKVNYEAGELANLRNLQSVDLPPVRF